MPPNILAYDTAALDFVPEGPGTAGSDKQKPALKTIDQTKLPEKIELASPGCPMKKV